MGTQAEIIFDEYHYITYHYINSYSYQEVTCLIIRKVIFSFAILSPVIVSDSEAGLRSCVLVRLRRRESSEHLEGLVVNKGAKQCSL